MFHADRRTDGQTDMTKLILAFRKFPNAPITCVHKAPTVRPTSSELTLCTTNYAMCRQPTARIAVSSGPPANSCHNKKISQHILFSQSRTMLPFSMPVPVFIIKSSFLPDVKVKVKVKVNQSRYRPGVAQMVPER